MALQFVFGKDIVTVSSDGEKKDWVAWAIMFSKAAGIPLDEIDKNFYLRGEHVPHLIAETVGAGKWYVKEMDLPYHIKAKESKVVEYRWQRFIVHVTDEPSEYYKEKVNLYCNKI